MSELAAMFESTGSIRGSVMPECVTSSVSRMLVNEFNQMQSSSSSRHRVMTSTWLRSPASSSICSIANV